MPVLRNHFPNAQLFGCDFSQKAVQRCKARFPDLGSFFTSDIERLSGTFDVIYSCSTLEHFVDYKEKTRHLLQHCRYLCILVPFNEKRNGQDLTYDPCFDHVVTFREQSFDFLVNEGYVKKIYPPKVFTVAGAWSWTFKERIVQTTKNLIRPLAKRAIVSNRKIILFEIERGN